MRVITFLSITKSNQNIQDINIFRNKFLYTVYADESTLVSKDKNYAVKFLKKLNTFSEYILKYEIDGTGVLKGVEVALHGMTFVNLKKETLKILRILTMKKFWSRRCKDIVKIWCMRQFWMKGGITVFKSLVISTVIIIEPHCSLLNSYSKYRKSLSDRKQTKIKHERSNNNYENKDFKKLILLLINNCD